MKKNGTSRPYINQECIVFDKDIEKLSKMVTKYLQDIIKDDCGNYADKLRSKVNNIAQIDICM